MKFQREERFRCVYIEEGKEEIRGLSGEIDI
jgi:hypothetical protein